MFGSKLPDVARNMGRSYHDFKKSMTDTQEQFRKAENEFRRPLDQPKAIGSQIAKEEDFEKPTSPKFTPPA